MTSPTTRLAAGVALLIVMGLAYLALLWHSGNADDFAPVLAIAGPVVTYLILGSKVDANAHAGVVERAELASTQATQGATLAAQNVQLGVITAQTNGILDGRIRAAAGEAVLAHITAAGAAALEPSTSGGTKP